jgi:hypothetical protein
VPSSDLVPCRARRELDETLQVLRVVVLNGPRQAGKTTLAKQLVAASGGRAEPDLHRPGVSDPSSSGFGSAVISLVVEPRAIRWTQ